MTWSDVVELARRLPETEEGTAYGTPALRVRGAFLGRLKEDGVTFAVRCDPEERPFLVEAHPGVLFVTPHYENWPMVLVALADVDPELVSELLEDAWCERAPQRLVDAYVAGREEPV